METVNVLVVSSKYTPEYAGSGLRARRTYARISEKFPVDFEVLTGSLAYNRSEVYHIDGHKVTRIAGKVFSSATDEKRKKGSSGIIEKFKNGCNYLAEAVLTWRYLILNIGRFEVMHIFGKNWVTSAAVTFAKILRKPLIVELCNEAYTPHHYEPFFFKALLGKRFPEGASIVCISEMLRKVCEEHGYKENVWCRPNPIDEKRFFIDRANKSRLRAKHTPFNDKDILLICISKFRPSKNQVFLLDVLRRLPDEFKLVLAGPLAEGGPLLARDRRYLEEIKKKAAESGLEGRVRIEAGFIDDVDEYLKMSDAFLFPTRLEALGTPMLEAISCGIPVIANRLPGVTDTWVKDGINGFISGLDADEFAEKTKKAIMIDRNSLDGAREKIISRCSSDLIDRRYFDLIKSAARRGRDDE